MTDCGHDEVLADVLYDIKYAYKIHTSHISKTYTSKEKITNNTILLTNSDTMTGFP